MEKINKTANILLVDDEPLNLEIIEEHLAPLNCVITTAENGKQAWGLLSADPSRFDVVLLDRMMPEMDGMEVLTLINNHALLTGIPVILQTARAAQSEIEEGLKAGAYYYIVKPFSKTVILETVTTAIRESLFFQANIGLIKHDKNDALAHTGQSVEFRGLQDVREIAAKVALQFSNPEKIVVGLVELMINAVEHGICEIGYTKKTELLTADCWEQEIINRLKQEKYKQRWATIKVELSEQQNKIIISDQGTGFDWQKYIEFDYHRMLDNHGRGIALANIMSFSKLEYLDGGSTVIAYVD